jgi:hypothetical protein
MMAAFPAMSPDHSDHSDAETPLAFNCPKCGEPLHPHAYRTEIDANGQLEKVYVYLCFKDGFFTFRNGTGLVEGL